MAIYLGLDSSTQSLTAVVIEVTGSSRRVLFEHSLRFDEDFGEFGTKNGVLPSEDPLVAHSSPVLWGTALDRMMDELRANVPVAEIRAIAGSGQQHGSIYLNRPIPELDASRALKDQIGEWLSRPTAPIWMDSSTRGECEEIAAGVGSDEQLAQITGSRAFERFSGPQIRKFSKEDVGGYESTERIHLVSSFMASLLAGRDASIDPGDGAGMNLMDLASKSWSDSALDATAPDLRSKLPDIEEAWNVVGPLSSYWVDRFGYSPDTKVVSWSGDNPCSLVGVGLVETGRVAISLGTSDTLFGYMPEARVDPRGEGHAFGSPTGGYMSLLCFKNGSLARENVRQQFGLDWEGFSKCLRESKPGNGGKIMLPWYEPEITPKVLEPGVRRYGGLDENDAPANVRAVIEAQMMSMAVHSSWMEVDFVTVFATGGAAANREILQVMANVHDADVYQFPVGNSAALGSALRALHADLLSSGEDANWRDVIREFAEPLESSRISPEKDCVAMYKELCEVFAACERHAVGGGADPAPQIEAFRGKYSS